MHYEKIKTQILKAACVYQKTKAHIFKKTGYIWVSIALIDKILFWPMAFD